MQTIQDNYVHPPAYDFDNSSDQEAFNLFKNINPNISSSSEKQPSQHLSEHQLSAEQLPKYSRLSKPKKQSKADKKARKAQKKKLKKKNPLSQFMNETPPRKKLKKQETKSKIKDFEEGEEQFRDEKGSSQQDSYSDINIEDQLNNLNPNSQQINTKRLKKSNRKVRIQQKQGFRIQELGNNPEINMQHLQKLIEDQSYSFDDIDNKKKKKKLKKKAVLSNEQIMQTIGNHGVVESQQDIEGQKMYDNGLQGLSKIKDKKKNGIKINNRLFGDLQIDLRDEEACMVPPEQLELQVKPKSSASQSRFSFLLKAQNIKKQRGLQANIDHQQFKKQNDEKAKKSLAKIVSSMASQQFHEQLDIQIKIPTIVRGKSAQIINNTVFLKRFMSKNESTQISQSSKPQSKHQNNLKKPFNSRNEFYKSIIQQNRLRRSNFISEDYLKNSFKKTNLQELQQARKKIQQKRKRQTFSQDEDEDQEEDVQQQQFNKQLNEMIDLQENVGEQQQADQQQNKNIQNQQQICKNKQDQKVELLSEKEVDRQDKVECQQDQEGEEEEQINANNQIIDELAQVSSNEQLQQQEQEEQQQDDLDNPNQEEQGHQDLSKQNIESEQVMNDSCMNQQAMQQKREVDQLEEQGITLKKRIKVTYQIENLQKDYLIQDIDGCKGDDENKQNKIDINNQIQEEKYIQNENKKDTNVFENQEQQFKNFRKLRKIAVIIAEKKKKREMGRRYAAQFLQNEAQEGSDNQDHDDIVKNIDYDEQDKQFQGLDLDADLVELIDNAVDINQEDEYEAFRKYLQDVRLQDRQQIRKIIKGQFKRKHDDLQLQIEQDEKKRQQRMQQVMEWMKKRQEEQGEGIYLKPPEEQQNQESDDDSYYKQQKKIRIQQNNDDQQNEKIPEEQERAMIERFLDKTLPAQKKQIKKDIFIDLGPLPESIRLQKSLSNRTVSISKLGSKLNQDNLIQNKSKKTSSLVNEILNRKSSSSSAKPQKSALGALIRSKKMPIK